MVPSLPPASMACRQTSTPYTSWAASRSWYSARSVTPSRSSAEPSTFFSPAALYRGWKSSTRRTVRPGSTRSGSISPRTRSALSSAMPDPPAGDRVDPIDGSLPGGDGSADALDRSGDTRRVAHPLPEPAMPELATDAVLRPARTGNAFEDALERLLQAVKLGVFRQGDRLPPSRDLAARLAVSRVTLREALHALEKGGSLELPRGRSGGAFVTHQPAAGNAEPLRTRAAELDDVLVHREAVEVGAAAAAARVPLTAVQSGYLRRRADDVAEASLAEYRQAHPPAGPRPPPA